MHHPCAFIDLDTQVLPILEAKPNFPLFQYSIIPSTVKPFRRLYADDCISQIGYLPDATIPAIHKSYLRPYQ
jgi:hypothetical protein